MVAVNRLTGHSPGFFSVYTLPPNQAVSAKSQAKINARREQTPPPRDVAAIILDEEPLAAERRHRGTRDSSRRAEAQFVTGAVLRHAGDRRDSVALAVTSPPFLDVVDYKTDNWLRCWFSGIDTAGVPVTLAKHVDAWQEFVDAHAARGDDATLRPGRPRRVRGRRGARRRGAARRTGDSRRHRRRPRAAARPDQRAGFTKTANCWGVTNNRKGTNTNRVVLFRKPR